jgi:hypothetical protein
VLTFLKKLKRLKVNLDQLVKYPVFPTRPYLIRDSKQFLLNAGRGMKSAVEGYLKKNRMMIFQIDSVRNYA